MAAATLVPKWRHTQLITSAAAVAPTTAPASGARIQKEMSTATAVTSHRGAAVRDSC